MCAVVSGDLPILYSCLRVLGGLIENDPPIVCGCVSKSDMVSSPPPNFMGDLIFIFPKKFRGDL